MTTTRTGAAATITACALAAMLTACTGGTESSAAPEQTPPREAPATQVDARQVLGTLGNAIPIYEGAQFREDLTKRDEVMIRNQYGPGAQVYTLATDDSFPQVYHYYTTYLAQFRAFPAQETYPPEQQDWRTFEVQLNQAMQDPFIPGAALSVLGRQVTLQIAETEAEPRTVIRYIVTPQGPPAVAAAPTAAQPVAR